MLLPNTSSSSSSSHPGAPADDGKMRHKLQNVVHKNVDYRLRGSTLGGTWGTQTPCCPMNVRKILTTQILANAQEQPGFYHEAEQGIRSRYFYAIHLFP